MGGTVSRILRADAAHNRDLVLEAARELMAERGLDVTMREIARAAGVGPATLYRRFPTRAALVDAAFADELRACRGIVESGCADPDPWRGLIAVIERLTVLNSRNRGFVDAFVARQPEAHSFAEHRAELLRMLARLTVRAKAAGRLRDDFATDDLLLILLAGRGLAASQFGRREAAARRFARLAVDSLRAEAPAPV